MSLSTFPPIVARQAVVHQDAYLRGNTVQRTNFIFGSKEQGISKTHEDWLAIAVLELRRVYNDRVPAGAYRNIRNYTFTVFPNGNMSSISLSSGLEGHVWRARCRPIVHSLQLGDYHFYEGGWIPAVPVAPSDVLHGQYPVPADLQGATFRGIVPDLPVPDPLASARGGNISGSATIFPQQPLFAATYTQHTTGAFPTVGQAPIGLTIANEADFDFLESYEEWVNRNREVLQPAIDLGCIVGFEV
ncbi:hypothetical protein B5807_11910 [Epicoccum nigrum]|uniref:Uncharacterized protein n=1 Tax=Epicoccum nigrum TaxID=105696 RepID=A0A1Y2LJJ8_EPING|nr:hypothetical protein B5807_11910 [Epicoccum nigrum]